MSKPLNTLPVNTLFIEGNTIFRYDGATSGAMRVVTRLLVHKDGKWMKARVEEEQFMPADKEVQPVEFSLTLLY